MTRSAPGESVVLSLGSNVGDSLATLQGAVDALATVRGLTLDAVSGVYRTPPWGGVDQDDFLNLIVLGTTTLTPLALLDRTQAIERAFGRTRGVRWGPRTLDIDLICVGLDARDTERLTLPHPRARERAFVLVPWLALDPDALLPGYGPVRDLVPDATGTATLTDQVVTLP